MRATHEVCIAAENGRLQVLRSQQMVGHHQELLSCYPLAVFGDHLGQLGDGARVGIACQDQVQYRHEVAFTTAKTPVQIGCLAGPALAIALD